MAWRRCLETGEGTQGVGKQEDNAASRWVGVRFHYLYQRANDRAVPSKHQRIMIE